MPLGQPGTFTASAIAAIKKQLKPLIKRTRPLINVQASNMQRMAVPPTNAGRGEKRAPATAFMKIERKQLLPVKGMMKKPPRWVRMAAEKRLKPQQAAELAIKRVMRLPTRGNFQTAQIMLNDLGRNPRNGKLLRQLVTQELVTKLTKKGG